MTEESPADPAIAALRALAARVEAAGRLAPPAATAILRSIVDAAVVLFDAEAASIALSDDAGGRLIFEVAAGAQGQGVVGLAIEASQGVAGYVFSTGQPIALSDVSADARFGRTTAEQTGYLPRSLVAVPLGDDDGLVGVLEILDKRSRPFDLRDVELAGVFARQATVAIRSTRLERDTAALFRSVISRIADSTATDGTGDRIDVEALVSAAARNLVADAGDPLWGLADDIARLHDADPAELDLVRELLAVLIRRAERRRASRAGRPVRGR
ncbi:MAG TPA: GAF domain-containing protein [Candidatus Limnocylindrales bacterium]|nr:GAF domain-containing protein [Candidatus Limnocylindrales bacterium]